MAGVINFFSETEFGIEMELTYKLWLEHIIQSEQKQLDELTFVFCSDDYLLKLNTSYLNHDTLTDIITFDYSDIDTISAEIYISIERVKDNAEQFDVDFDDELKRVLAHGVLHCCGYNDSTSDEKALMRQKENEKIKLFHVEQN
jgi:rRNA maturation RNase YbeY